MVQFSSHASSDIYSYVPENLYAKRIMSMPCGREQQIEVIEESFRAAKLRPKHLTKPELEPVEILPLLPDFER